MMRGFLADIFRLSGIDVKRHHDPYLDAKSMIGRPLGAVVERGAHRGTVTRKLLKLFPSAMVRATSD
jgi:hypothetical protein